MKLSIVAPVYNEEQNLPILYHEIVAALHSFSGQYEMIFVNDASTDKSLEALRLLAKHDVRVKIISFYRNFGQTAAMSAGFSHASGEVIVSLDSDLQNDPAEILRLVAHVTAGYDIVCGWRKDRKDAFLTRKIPSWIANRLISKVTGVALHDYGCTLRAYRKETVDSLKLYGEMHRLIPAYAVANGARVVELPVRHRPRIHGVSKYGLARTMSLILDLLLFVFLNTFMNKPIHFFGGIGLLSCFFGFVAASASVLLKILGYRDFVETPLPLFAAMLVLISVPCILMGIISEVMMRTYYESHRGTPYTIREIINP